IPVSTRFEGRAVPMVEHRARLRSIPAHCTFYNNRTVQVDKLETWPASALRQLRTPGVIDLFKQKTFIDHFDYVTIDILGKELVECAYREGLVGFHCTKEPEPEYFKRTGLEITDPKRSVQRFLDLYQNNF